MKRCLPILLVFAGILTGLESTRLCAAGEPPQETRDEPTKPFNARGRIGLEAIFVDIEGSREKYRTDINDLPGGSLSDFQFELWRGSSDGQWLDYLRLSGHGFGDAEPYEQAELSFGKRGRYEFRGRYWKQNYFFNVPSYALTGLAEDSARRNTDLTLRFFPRQGMTIEAGYLRQRQFGTSFSSSEDFTRLFELISPRRSLTQDFRVGLSFRRPGSFFSVFQNFRRFKEDLSEDSNRLLEPGQLPQLASSRPVRRSVPSTRILAKHSPNDRWTLEGSYQVSLGRADALLSRFLTLQLSQGLELEEIVRSVSRSDRPDHRAKGAATFSPNPWFSLSNRFEFHTFDVSGDLFSETRLGSPIPGTGAIQDETRLDSFLDFRFLRYQPTAEFFVHPKLMFFAGYRLVDRLVERTGGLERHESTGHTALGGALWRPYRGSRVRLEFESGTSDDAFTRTEPRDVSRLRVSTRLPLRSGWSVGGHLLLSDRSSRQEESNFNSEQRQGGIDVTYSAGEKLSLSGAYSLIDLETSTDILFFVSRRQVEETSIYTTRLHLGNARFHWQPNRFVSFRGAYTLLKDPRASSFPLNRHAGEAGIRFLPGGPWSWDLEWRRVSYDELLSELEDYSANRLAVSMLWSFGEW